MIYAAFTFWLVMILFAGLGIYKVWGQMLSGRWSNWTLLPGTLVSEMAYIFGSLITGGEIRRAKLMDDAPGKGKGGGSSSAGTQTEPKLKFIGPMVASLMTIVACGGAILVVNGLLGETVLQRFDAGGFSAGLAKELPKGWDATWTLLRRQVDLLQRVSETFGDLSWSNWRVPLFVYLATCLSVRLAPVGRPMAPTLAATALVAIVIAFVGLVSTRFNSLMQDVWPLLTYVWGNVLLLLAISLLIRGLVGLVQSLRSSKS